MSNYQPGPVYGYAKPGGPQQQSNRGNFGGYNNNNGPSFGNTPTNGGYYQQQLPPPGSNGYYNNQQPMYNNNNGPYNTGSNGYIQGPPTPNYYNNNNYNNNNLNQSQSFLNPMSGTINSAPPVTMQAPANDLVGWFNSVDTDRSGRIDAVELSRALRKGGINLSVIGAARIMAMFDTNRSGQINFQEFQQLHPFVQHMAKSFKLRDKTGNGRIEPSELHQMLIEGAYNLDHATFQTLLQKFDSEGRGSMGFEDFVQIKVFLHNAKKIFDHYDVNRSGKVLFSVDSFLEAAVAVK